MSSFQQQPHVLYRIQAVVKYCDPYAFGREENKAVVHVMTTIVKVQRIIGISGVAIDESDVELFKRAYGILLTEMPNMLIKQVKWTILNSSYSI